MKIRNSIWCVGSIVILSAVSCKEKPSVTEEKGEEKSIVDTVVDKVKETVVPLTQSLSDEERAAKVGFAQYLPQDTEVVFSVYDTKGAAEQLKALRLYGIIERESGMGMEMEDEIIEEMIEEDMMEEGDAEQENDMEMELEAQGGEPDPWMLLGQEVTFALGKPTGEQVGHLLTLNKRMGYFQALALGKAAQKFAESGDPDDFTDAIENTIGDEGFFLDLLEDPEGGVNLFKDMVMPPLYIAFRAKEGELDQAAQLVGGSMGIFAMAGEMAVPIEFETGGATFSGYKLLGEKLSETLAENRDSMEENLKPETVSALLDAIAKKNLVVVSGTIGNYVVAMIGGDEADLKLAADVKDSLVGTDELNFVDAFADKPLLALSYGGKDGWEGIMDDAGGLASYAIGIRDGIAGGEALGDTRDLEALLQMIADREKDLMSLGSANDFGMVAFTDEGLKVETFGGYDKGSLDWSAKTSLSHLGDSGDNVLFFNAASDADYNDKVSAYFEAIFETLYASTMKLSEIEVKDGDLLEAKQFAEIFDTQFRTDVIGLYEAVSGGLSDGIGDETAIVIDLKGATPAVPGIPQELVDEAKVPRITWVAPVTDRSKLAESWKQMDSSISSLLSKASEMFDVDIPMQKPISSDKDGMTTWFFSFPFFQDDFLPSVTVSDDWFAASTSKLQAVDLIGKAAAGGEAGNGMEFYVNFNALTDYADMMLAVVEKNKDSIFTNEYDLGDFNRNKEGYKEIIEACRDFDSLTWTAKKENGYVRNSMHFKTK
ncbi:MAG: hypothetical protein NWT08_14630 [Akkermansiaceae bacterium]|jgi:hypothetical protein|nr:hypothetical protein [Akkermansiaceae bacterium]MDP4646658.1 hypothetical protein [Akkermansiaceae bacterium]MDP4721132.1 hypothetical protein [Akkermansiaceae bacterium]MDP4779574.1 hypothetical protein [Akkermansiaceae bacterium]MDP4846346.1 hypothetical protein [Akkermansiaceae bacterium]